MKEECVCVCNVHGTNKTSARSRYLLSMDNRKNVLRKKKKEKKIRKKRMSLILSMTRDNTFKKFVSKTSY